jgi:hypothetical protein
MTFSFNYNNASPYYIAAGDTFDISATIINPPAFPLTFASLSVLPANVAVNPTTGNIYTNASLTYASLSPVTLYTIRATYNITQTADASFNLGIFIPPGFSYPFTPYLLTQNVVSYITPVYDVYNFLGTVYNVGSTPLPTGLVLNTSTGDITGTPTLTSVPTVYTIQATYNNIIRTASLTITVNAIPIISYPQASYILTQDEPVNIVAIIPAGQQYDSITISCILPRGLTFNTANGTITGIPVIPTTVIPYTVTISNVIGSSTTILLLSIIKTKLSERGLSDNTSTGLLLSDPENAMRLKAEILQYKGNSMGLTKKQQWQQVVKANNSVNNRVRSSVICTTTPTLCAPSSSSGVPGPVVTLCYNPARPLMNYLSITRVRTNIGHKYPQRTWMPGDNGFPVGKAGSEQ